MSPFKDKVIEVINLVPKGKVVSYGQVALFVGMPRAARQVGWILNGLEGNTPVPWWRVVNNTGRISIKGSRYGAEDQRRFLEKEGVKVNDDLTFDISKYRFQPNDKFITKLKLDPVYLEMIGNKIPFSKKIIT
jgi:methylated-DNA-protein-cysteine methyltransferase related protein